MIFIYVVILAGIFGAIGQYLDKHLANIGTSKKDYFYYILHIIPILTKCLSTYCPIAPNIPASITTYISINLSFSFYIFFFFKIYCINIKCV